MARLELGEEAMRSPDQQSSVIAGEAHWHLKKESRDRHRKERKFVIVVSRVDKTPVQEQSASYEIPVSRPGQRQGNKVSIAEAPGDLPQTQEELPGGNKGAEVPG